MPRGAQNLPKEKLKEWASKGGKAAQDKGTGRRWTTEEARKAGQLGGLKKAENRRNANNSGGSGGSGQDKGNTPQKE